MRTNLIKEEVEEEVIKTSNKTNSKNTTIHILHILDASGSMAGPKFRSAFEGMEEEINSIKADNGGIKHTYSIVEFDEPNRIKTIISKVDVDTLTMKDIVLYNPNGMTALYDAIGKTLSNFEVDSKDKVIVKIFTDGAENASNTWKADKLSELIKIKETLGWVITFVGTDYDVKNMINRLGISKNNTLSYDGSASGLRSSYSVANSARVEYTKAVLDGTESTRTLNFFGN